MTMERKENFYMEGRGKERGIVLIKKRKREGIEEGEESGREGQEEFDSGEKGQGRT